MTERTKEFEEAMSQNKVFEKPWAIKGCSKSLTVKKKKRCLVGLCGTKRKLRCGISMRSIGVSVRKSCSSK